MLDLNLLDHDLDNLKDFKEPARPPSEQLAYLHIYLVPKERWLEKRKLAKNHAVDHTISVGFVRVLPQTYLCDLRKEMDRQLGLESLPPSYVFLRSVGRNFTELRPRQEMEMKVKSFLPPYAADPEIYLKEGTYTGPNTWSQGEDSGLEESLDSNSQRSQDRGTPESLADEQLVLPKVSLVPSCCELDDLRSSSNSPPDREMAISVAADESLTTDHPELQKDLPYMKASHRTSADIGRRYRKEQDILDSRTPPKDATDAAPAGNPKNRAGSLNRKQSRGTSKERGGTQLPTWAETRTTRLRRNKALGDSKLKNNNNILPRRPDRSTSRKKNVQKKKLSSSLGLNLDAEDEEDDDDNGKILMERIRANSRCLRARLSSQTRRHGTESEESREASENSKYRGDYNGVYTMHTRRHCRTSTHDVNKDEDLDNVEIENTSIQLLDESGQMVDLTGSVPTTSNDLDNENEEMSPEILNLHVLSAEGEDAREIDEHSQEVSIESHYVEIAEKENLEGNIGAEPPPEVAVEEATPSATAEGYSSQDGGVAQEEIPQQQAPVDYLQVPVMENLDVTGNPSAEIVEEYNPSTAENLEEGQTLSKDGGNLTIEVEVKEINGSQPENDLTEATNFLQIDHNIEYDSYPVYSEQNQHCTPAVEYTVPVSATKRYTKHSRAGESRSRTLSRKQDRPQYSRGIYLRKMEHRDQGLSELKRTKSDGGALDTIDRLDEESDAIALSHTRRGGMGSIEKWNTTSSTGDLRELPWDHVPEKERLLTILDGVRQETRVREKQREELLRRIKQLQSRVHQRQEQGEETQTQNPDYQNRCLRSLPQFARRADSAPVREMWRKRYIEAKKVTPRVEEECSRLRLELDKLHRELLAKVQAGVWALLTISGKTEKPSNKLSYKIMIARLLQEIEDLSRRVEGTRLKLHTEMKLRAMAEKDVRNLREELLKKKIQVTLTRNQEQAAMGNSIRQQYFISAV